MLKRITIRLAAATSVIAVTTAASYGVLGTTAPRNQANAAIKIVAAAIRPGQSDSYHIWL